MIEQFAALVPQVRAARPLVHHITNYVTVNDCANITLAIGGSPIMADDAREAPEVVAAASALVLNMGTLSGRTIPSMVAAGRAANLHGVPVVIDPVGAGASALRNETAALLLREVRVAVLRGNLSEIRYLAGRGARTRGVDAGEGDAQGAEEIARDVAARLGCVVAVTGAVDVVSDGRRVLQIENGHPMLSAVTGTGCMCTSLVGAFVGAAPEGPLQAAAAALLAMGIAGEIAHGCAGQLGNGSFRVALHDAMSRMDAQTMRERGRCHEA